ncbi:MAG: hypothetical protein U9R08_05565 [Nanoarchaeota archaeon]|nr:hypothetical protein [Nanoarchaeota archaeon]
MSLEDNIEKTERTPSFRKKLLAGALTIAGLATALFPSTAHAIDWAKFKKRHNIKPATAADLIRKSHGEYSDSRTGTTVIKGSNVRKVKGIDYTQNKFEFLKTETAKNYPVEHSETFISPSLSSKNQIESGTFILQMKKKNSGNNPVTIEIAHSKNDKLTPIFEKTFNELKSSQKMTYVIRQYKENGEFVYRITGIPLPKLQSPARTDIEEALFNSELRPCLNEKTVTFYLEDNKDYIGLEKLSITKVETEDLKDKSISTIETRIGVTRHPKLYPFKDYYR